MNAARIVSAVVVAGLAMVTALLTGNFIRAAESAAQVSHPGVIPAGRAMAVTPAWTGLSLMAGSPGFAASFPPFGRKLDLAYIPGDTFSFSDPALVHAFNLPGAGRLPEMDSVARAGAADSESKTEIRHTPVPVDAAEMAARNEAELNEMFAVAPRVDPARVEAARNAQGERGKQVYLSLCYACHQPDGQGLPGAFPMLAKSDYMVADRTRAIRIVLEGMTGPVTVNGQTINSAMPGQSTVLTDQQIADVLTYVFNAWGNPGGAFTARQVEAIRNETPRD
jgi:nitrite reductase (NO-forming)